MIMPDALGITNISDLSPADLEKVRSLALLELTVTFEDHGIPLRARRPVKVKNWPGKADPSSGEASFPGLPRFLFFSFCSV